MKELVVGMSVLVMDDADYEFLKNKKIDFRKNKNGEVYPYLALHRMHFNDNKLHGMVVDHINRNTLDFRKSNLRLATRAENNANSSPKKEGVSIFKGVNWDKRGKCWVSKIGKGEINLFLGRYDLDKEELAARAYDIAAIYLHKDFAYLNFPIETYKDLDIKEELFKILSSKPRNNTSGYRGVCIDKRQPFLPYYVTVKKNKKSLRLGSYATALEAALIRDNWYRKNGIVSNTRLNFPTIEELIKEA